jgi:hypothetical protein
MNFHLQGEGEAVRSRKTANSSNMVAPDDGSKIDIGHVKPEGQNRIKINFEDPKIQSSTLNIVSCDENVLRIKK